MTVYKPVVSVVLQEVRGEISLGFMAYGCPLACKGCSYRSLTDTAELTLEEYTQILDRHQGLCTCVVWMGGEWVEGFPAYLSVARQRGYKTCLYTGREIDQIGEEILSQLDFVKTGRWTGVPVGDQGSNQKFIRL